MSSPKHQKAREIEEFPGRWTAWNDRNEYAASFVHLEDAAALVAVLGDGATIRDEAAQVTPRSSQKSVVWREGAEDKPAGESYDHVAIVATERAERTPKFLNDVDAQGDPLVGCGATGFDGQNGCTRGRGHDGAHRCSAADVHDRLDRGGRP